MKLLLVEFLEVARRVFTPKNILYAKLNFLIIKKNTILQWKWKNKKILGPKRGKVAERILVLYQITIEKVTEDSQGNNCSWMEGITQ